MATYSNNIITITSNPDKIVLPNGSDQTVILPFSNDAIPGGGLIASFKPTTISGTLKLNSLGLAASSVLGLTANQEYKITLLPGSEIHIQGSTNDVIEFIS